MTPYNNHLLNCLVQNRCVVWIGSGLSKHSHDLPTWGDFIRGLRDSLPFAAEERESAGDDQLRTYPLEFLEYAKEKYPVEFQREVQELLNVRQHDVRDAHREVAKLACSAIVTTNLDRLIEEGLRSANKKYVVVTQESDVVRLGDSPSQLPVIKMHGDVAGKQVLTLQDYASFENDYAAIVDVLRGYLVSYPLLIVGAGLVDQNFQRLFSHVFSRLRGVQHPVFYVSGEIPRFVRRVWERRRFQFINVPHSELTDWLRGLNESVRTLQVAQNAMRAPAIVGRATKKQALLRLGEHLADYEALQSIYTMQIQLADYALFESLWHQTLYQPLAELLETAITSYSGRAQPLLAYIAPGSHVPALSRLSHNTVRRLSGIVLADIDDNVTEDAHAEIARVDGTVSLVARKVDVTCGGGDRLCRELAKIIKSISLNGLSTAVDDVVRDIIEAFRTAIPEDEKATAEFAQVMGCSGDQELFDIVYSEMVASFTATAVLMSFRSALVRAIGGGRGEDLNKIIHVATKEWQVFNDRMLLLHLKMLAAITRKGGIVVLAYDTLKVFDDPSIASISSFHDRARLDGDLALIGLSPNLRKKLYWRDHNTPFKIELQSLVINDFLAHQHEVWFEVMERQI